MIAKSYLPQGTTATRGQAVVFDDVQWGWPGGMIYVHTTAEQPWHGTYMMNEHDPSMLHDGSVMDGTYAGGGEGLGGPPVLHLSFS